MKKIIYSVAILVALSGCNHLNIRDFERSEHVSVSDNKSGLVVFSKTDSGQDIGAKIKAEMQKSEELKEVINKYCRTEQKLAPALIPLVTAFGKYAFDLYLDKQSKDAEKLKKAATSTYSEVVHINADKFKSAKCAIVYRMNSTDEDVKFLSVISLKDYENAFSFSPVYVKALDTIAVTKAPKKGEDAKINASIAMTIKTVGIGKDGLPRLSNVGGDVVTITNINIGPNARSIKCKDDCIRSDLIPYITNSDQIISVKVAVTEMGKLGVDIDEKKAEYEALKEAFGPVVSEVITFRLNELYGSE